MTRKIDSLLSKLTMYRLTLYSLIFLYGVAIILSIKQKLVFAPEALLYSLAIILIVSWLTNYLFARFFKTISNNESVYITAFILTFLISPPLSGKYLTILPFLIGVAVLSEASKYLIAIGKKHIFNPAAFAVVVVAATFGYNASWWITSIWMLPFVAVVGIFITFKIRRWDLVLSFLVATTVSIFFSKIDHIDPIATLNQLFVVLPTVFFATVMLTEPATTPPSRFGRIVYGFITGILFIPNPSILYFTFGPALALCCGNIISWIISPKFKYIMTLKSKEKIARDTGEFIFSPNRRIAFKPGQYMEWTIESKKSDGRGNRRYLSIASSPTASDVAIGVKFDSKRSSSFKRTLAELEEGKAVIAGQLGGNLILPRNKKRKICLIAEGIGITPFCSMMAYMLDSDDKRDAVLVYCCKRFDELAYTNLIHRAHTQLGLKTVSLLTDLDHLPTDWAGYKGQMDVSIFLAEVPDYADRLFYISGSPAFVEDCCWVLQQIGIGKDQVKSEYLPR